MRQKWRSWDRATAGMCAVAVALLGVAGFREVQYRGIGIHDGPTAQRRNEIPPEKFFELVSTGKRIGPVDASVNLLVFSSYGCGHCAEFEPSLLQLQARYPDHVAIIVKHFMPGASRGAIAPDLAAECAADQGKFPEVHHALFATPALRGRDGWRHLTSEVFLPDSARYVTCVRSRQFAARVAMDTEEGMRLQVSGTPTTFINGVRVVGAVPLAVLDTLVALELERKPRGAIGAR